MPIHIAFCARVELGSTEIGNGFGEFIKSDAEAKCFTVFCRMRGLVEIGLMFSELQLIYRSFFLFESSSVKPFHRSKL